MALIGTINSSNDFGLKNRIINGAMVLDQRKAGASVSVSTSGVYVLDRWKNRANGGGVFTVQQSSTAPAGFNYSTIYTVTTADSSIAAADNYWIIHEIEGYNVADLAWGTANAQTVTVSFWVRSSVTGTYTIALSNGTTYDRHYVSTYTINAANTFEYKTITIAGDTTGTWGKTNGGGISLVFNLGTGTDYQTTANAWTAGFKHGTASSTNLIATNGATFYITGVQFEKGSTATSFDYRPFGTEFALCQRYYEKSYGLASLPGSTGRGGTIQQVNGVDGNQIGGTKYTVPKRTNPTVTLWSDAGVAASLSTTGGSNAPNAGSWAAQGANENGFGCIVGTGGLSNSTAYYFHYAADAEL
jgi:hypothetical protein